MRTIHDPRSTIRLLLPFLLLAALTGLTARAEAGVEFDDPFTETSDKAVTSHVPNTLGSGYTEIVDIGTCTLYIKATNDEISANQSRTSGACANNETSLLQANDAPSGANYEVSVLGKDLTSGNPATNTGLLACRIQNASNMYAVRFNTGDSDLYKRVSGTWTSLGDGPGIATGSTVVLRCVGSAISLLDDGVAVIGPVTDTAHSAAGKAGIGMGALILSDDDINATELDNFKITVISETTPPTPNPMTFVTAPNDASTTSVNMTATTASDASTPITYLFTYTACGANAGTGGTSSAWQSGTTYTDSGLQVNMCYGYTVQAKDSLGNTGTASAAASAYTTANTPAAPTVSTPTATTLTVDVNVNSNPSHTTFAIAVDDDGDGISFNITKYVQANGTIGALAVWQNDATWGATVVTGLTTNRLYRFKAKARNGDNDETALSTEATGTPTSATDLYRSVGITATDLNTLARTVTISGTTATFSAAMPTTVGVGDVLQYPAGSPTSLAFIHGRTSDTVYTVKSSTGGTPTAAGAGTAVAVYRAYTSLFNWEAQTENTSIALALRDFDTSTALTTNNTVMHVACYGDGADTTRTGIDGWTTGASNYIRIFTPVSTSEVGASQRHNGTWSTGAYLFELAGTFNGGLLEVADNDVRIEGLQLRVTSLNAGASTAPLLVDGTGIVVDFRISHSILRGVTNATNTHSGLNVYAGNAGSVVRAYNNIIYDFTGESSSGGILMSSGATNVTLYAYNNTVHNGYNGYVQAAGTFVAKNNIAQDCTDGFAGTFDAASNYNVSDLASDAPGANSRNSTTVTFANEVGDDFHLAGNDAGAKNFGTDLSADGNLAFTGDIEGNTRPVGSAWDMGADEVSDTTAPTITGRDTADLDADGFIDAVQLTFSEAILDSSVDANDFAVSGGVTVAAFSSTAGGDTADDADIYIQFTDGVLRTGDTPTIAYSQSGGQDVSDAASNLLASSAATATTDKAKPVLLTAQSNRGTSDTIFNAVGERLDLIFSETLGAAPSEANLEAALTFAGGATDSGNNLPDIGTGANPITLVTTTLTNDTIRITRNTNNADSGVGQLLTPGTHTVQVTTGTNITDASAAANPANTVPAALTMQANAAPSISSQRRLFDHERTPETKPEFTWEGADAEGDALEYEIRWDTDPNFGAPTVKASANYPTDAGWTAATFASGAAVTYLVQAANALSNNTTYYWQLRARDPTGGNTWSGWTTKRAVTVDTSLPAPAWHQTTQAQFQTDTLSANLTATGTNDVRMSGP